MHVAVRVCVPPAAFATLPEQLRLTASLFTQVEPFQHWLDEQLGQASSHSLQLTPPQQVLVDVPHSPLGLYSTAPAEQPQVSLTQEPQVYFTLTEEDVHAILCAVKEHCLEYKLSLAQLPL